MEQDTVAYDLANSAWLAIIAAPQCSCVSDQTTYVPIHKRILCFVLPAPALGHPADLLYRVDDNCCQ